MAMLKKKVAAETKVDDGLSECPKYKKGKCYKNCPHIERHKKSAARGCEMEHCMYTGFNMKGGCCP